ncbi:hypothetical protein [Caballeronia sp. ATUFL_M1_KS5A]|uniref:hypothetical protein n=1 Tax=Caballeronia sp. ATUFL_M1_KS5A TaxID=2921778 RepID=UPI002027A896|nr:hypothetical protein [Caballeronia sp. ATUFL_M1_KS5A]
MKVLIFAVALAASLAGCASGVSNGFDQAALGGYSVSIAGNIQAGCPIPVSSTDRNLLCYAN